MLAAWARRAPGIRQILRRRHRQDVLHPTAIVSGGLRYRIGVARTRRPPSCSCEIIWDDGRVFDTNDRIEHLHRRFWDLPHDPVEAPLELTSPRRASQGTNGAFCQDGLTLDQRLLPPVSAPPGTVITGED